MVVNPYGDPPSKQLQSIETVASLDESLLIAVA